MVALIKWYFATLYYRLIICWSYGGIVWYWINELTDCRSSHPDDLRLLKHFRYFYLHDKNGVFDIFSTFLIVGKGRIRTAVKVFHSLTSKLFLWLLSIVVSWLVSFVKCQTNSTILFEGTKRYREAVMMTIWGCQHKVLYYPLTRPGHPKN